MTNLTRLCCGCYPGLLLCDAAQALRAAAEAAALAAIERRSSWAAYVDQRAAFERHLEQEPVREAAA